MVGGSAARSTGIREGVLTFYPAVLSEAHTLQRVLSGASLARYGDGELNLARSLNIPCQRQSERLTERLRGILQDSGQCLVGIPNIRSETPKAAFWARYVDIAPRFLTDRQYVSAFISRPDSAPWIDTDLYWLALESLWAGKDVTLVRGNSAKALQAEDLLAARSVREIVTLKKDAFTVYDALLRYIGTPSGLVLLCLGPTATVLAVDLCARGVHAVDLGHVAIFKRKHERGDPMPLTVAEKALA